MSSTIAEIETKDGIQSINLPEEFRINDDRVIMKKVGSEIHLIPYHAVWEKFFNSTTLFTEDFMETRDQGEDQEREPFD